MVGSSDMLSALWIAQGLPPTLCVQAKTYIPVYRRDYSTVRFSALKSPMTTVTLSPGFMYLPGLAKNIQ